MLKDRNSKNYTEPDSFIQLKEQYYIYVCIFFRKIITIKWDKRNNKHKILRDAPFGWEEREGWNVGGNGSLDMGCW